MREEERTCETCDHCIYIGEGDFICDRIDPDGNYCPENCRFADMVVQQNNRRDRSNDVQVYLGQDGIYHASPNCGRRIKED